MVNGMIQAFPWDHWKDEFATGAAHGLHFIEWTLDQERLHENPLLTPEGQREIRALCERHGVGIPSLTGDCFMQAPFWKAGGAREACLKRDFRAVVDACAALGISMIVVPLVDNGGIETPEQEDTLVAFLESLRQSLTEKQIQIVFESDFVPGELARFMDRLDPELFGVNYDIGNSAALGYDLAEEMAAYGHRILNIHVKDRVLGGTTVPLGTGNADLKAAFDAFRQLNYSGNYILQTARAEDNAHADALSRYRDMVVEWMNGS